MRTYTIIYTHIHATIDHHPPCNQHQTCVCVWLDLMVQNAKERVSSKGWLYTAKCIDAFDHVLNSRDLFRTHSNHANQIPFPQKCAKLSICMHLCTPSTVQLEISVLHTIHIYIYNYVYIYIYIIYILYIYIYIYTYVYIIYIYISMHISIPDHFTWARTFRVRLHQCHWTLDPGASKCIILDRLKWKSRGNHGFLSLQRFTAIFLYRFWEIILTVNKLHDYVIKEVFAATKLNNLFASQVFACNDNSQNKTQRKTRTCCTRKMIPSIALPEQASHFATWCSDNHVQSFMIVMQLSSSERDALSSFSKWTNTTVQHLEVQVGHRRFVPAFVCVTQTSWQCDRTKKKNQN